MKTKASISMAEECQLLIEIAGEPKSSCQNYMDWSLFCRESRVMRQEMKGLISFAGSLANLNVLDLGCGSGELSQLLHESQVRWLTVLDSSPQMLHFTKLHLANNQNVSFALCKIPTYDREDIDIEGQKYDLIVLHQCLPSIASDLNNLTTLARWCSKFLTPNGRLILAAYDRVVNLDKKRWNDPFRETLQTSIPKTSDIEKFLRPQQQLFRIDEVERAVKAGGFSQKHREIKTISFSMDERRLMWKVPAILDSWIDVERFGTEKASDLVQAAFEKIKGSTTKDRTVIYWSFSK